MVSPAAALLITASTVTIVVSELIYTPSFDVRSHANITLDVLDITDHIEAGDIEGAKEIYITGKNRDGKNVQSMARIDWEGVGVEDLSDYEAYAALFRPGNGEPYLDSFTLDAMDCMCWILRRTKFRYL
mmetsp:Transcript_19034/g.23424  ORF Transcript_19034/g.23424 Transcript_19034/m.23424 type:complete len:129 (-) Transcript_19034:289-675(-)